MMVGLDLRRHYVMVCRIDFRAGMHEADKIVAYIRRLEVVNRGFRYAEATRIGH